MSQDITIIGNLAAQPELKFTPQGKAVASFTIVTSTRVKDERTGQWDSKDVTYWNCNAWDNLGTNISESLDKGDKVIAFGKASSVTWEDKQTGQKRSKMQVTIKSLGIDLTKNQVKIFRDNQPQPATLQNDDPWQSPVGGWQDDVAPF